MFCIYNRAWDGERVTKKNRATVVTFFPFMYQIGSMLETQSKVGAAASAASAASAGASAGSAASAAASGASVTASPAPSPAATADLPDETLIRRVLEGDKRAFEWIIRRHNQRLFRAGMAMLQNDMDVEDAMQTAYINAYLHLADFKHRSSFSTWLTRIMINQCLLQKRKRSQAQAEATPDNQINMRTPDRELGNKELSSLLENAVEQLPEKYRLVFVLREVEDLSVRETSEVIGIEEANVKTRLNRAKTMLRAQLQGYMKDHLYSFHLTRCDRIVANVFAALG
jgi:RNA polymerase sigma factor (sigma-70 family)